MTNFGAIFLDALLDSLKILPFLLVFYIIMELIENKTGISSKKRILEGQFAPLLGAASGIIPQCGFSIMASKFFDKNLIKMGTLVAVFIASSDEALILLLSPDTKKVYVIMPIIVIKFISAVLIGYLINLFFRNKKLQNPEEVEEIHGSSCGHNHKKDSAVKTFLVHPLLHSLKIFAFIFIVNLAFGLIIATITQERLTAILQQGLWWQPLLATFVGLIPNCASSVVLTEAYINAGISFGALMAGLSANAGLGLLFLFKNRKEWKRNLLVLVILFVASLVIGYVTQGVQILFQR